ncbi:MAG: DNA-protecting protein DprA [Candidatus Spechtbacteria bacterium]|nr:DNA-protecting protein DprA [Candidatus Spechtbacteria bacterium]
MQHSSHKKMYPAISIHDEHYPPQLREIAQAPKVLYIRGHIPKDKPMIGVVGTRRCTPYGRRVTEHIVRGLVRAGVVIVSGMANGIDTEAHKAALEAGGQTIAVVGSGIDESVIYPTSNKFLAREIETHGAVISEFDPYARSETFYFPQRNRVISGLSLGIVVIEAPEKSGALITANFALEQNREVFAVPGGIFWENSKGTNNLIQQGAKSVTCAEDILMELNLPIPEDVQNRIHARNPIEQKILEFLLRQAGAPAHIDMILTQTKLSASDISSALSLMELEDRVKNLGGNHYVLAP